jgi:hypothetical protein
LEREISCNQWEGSWGLSFFFWVSWGEEGEGDFFVPNVFSSGSQHVPQICNVCPKMFSIAPHFFSLAMVQFSCIYLVKVGPKERTTKPAFIQGRESFLGFMLESASCYKKIGDEAMGLINAHNSCPTISLDQKWCQTKLGFQILGSQ